ncbi:HK97-gp10 family putative phage morphogenesis protein [Cohnella lubricantis]|uniref:HK97 gp10 family phage protein n=1 Tax=Cohnella lubricantis TaxID=2163172 RepID=A0A841T9A3_9BACL|nr:HK97-gp10 family putative phage morphogenesis protein [Cohnella lubricantis]MBB6677522.1 HK97 gp10 family phage protein [Cohnella lubricantis]MBP2116592.1 HK97 gp10 family phage protein [Cohnella lubricantis]
MAGFELQGVDEWLDALRRKLGEASARVENRGLRAAGEIMAGAMRDKAPVSEKASGTHIRDDIKVSGVRRKDGVKYVLVGPSKKTSWRAHFPEFGTQKMTARSFIYPAFHEKKDAALAALADEFREGLENG